MTKHNEYGVELFLSAMERYQSGTSNIRTALRDAAKGYGEMYRHIVASNGGVEPKGPAMANALKGILTSRGATVNIVNGWIDDRPQRMALLWMDQNADKVAWVFSNSEAATPMSIYNAWQNYFRKTVKAEWEENEAEGGVEPKDLLGVALPGVTLDEVEAEWTRLNERKAKRKEEPDVMETTFSPDIDPIKVLVSYLAEANERELDAIQTMINERRNRIHPVTVVSDNDSSVKQPEWIWDLDDASITAHFQSCPHRVVDFAVFLRGQPDEPVLTGRWAKSAKMLMVTTPDGRREEIQHSMSKVSSRQLKLVLGHHIGGGPAIFNGSEARHYALVVERL